MHHLVFALEASMGAMGDVAGHARRRTLDWPGRSALLGLVAAAMGIRRNDAEALKRIEVLGTTVGFVSKVLTRSGWKSTSAHITDFHTIQSAPEANSRAAQSRKEGLELAGNSVVTSITQRDYRTDLRFVIALWCNNEGLLSEIEVALKEPSYVLFLGRKSCPLSAPLWPQCVSSATPTQALRDYAARRFQKEYPEKDVPETLISRFATDPWDARAVQSWEHRRDRLVDRAAWHFAERKVILLPGDA